MKLKNTLIFLLLCSAISIQAQNGKIVERKTFALEKNVKLYDRITKEENGTRVLLPKYQYLEEVVMEEIFYKSDGLKVKAYLAYPKNSKIHPAIIYNRGGNREFGALNEFKMAFIIARAASWGYTVVASQYRGNDGGEGVEQFGGDDVHDIINLIPLLENMPNVDTTKIGMYGWSRGGMMTFLSLMQTSRIKAAAVGGALSDLKMMNDSRGGEMEKYVYSELMPDYYAHKDSLLASRSAITQVDKICKTTPILMLHGTSDWRVVPEESLNMALAFQKEQIPYRLVMYEGGDHGLSEFNDEVDEAVKAWFDKYLKNNQALPDLKPHGK